MHFLFRSASGQACSLHRMEVGSYCQTLWRNRCHSYHIGVCLNIRYPTVMWPISVSLFVCLSLYPSLSHARGHTHIYEIWMEKNVLDKTIIINKPNKAPTLTCSHRQQCLQFRVWRWKALERRFRYISSVHFVHFIILFILLYQRMSLDIKSLFEGDPGSAPF